MMTTLGVICYSSAIYYCWCYRANRTIAYTVVYWLELYCSKTY